MFGYISLDAKSFAICWICCCSSFNPALAANKMICNLNFEKYFLYYFLIILDENHSYQVSTIYLRSTEVTTGKLFQPHCSSDTATSRIAKTNWYEKIWQFNYLKQWKGIWVWISYLLFWILTYEVFYGMPHGLFHSGID